MQYNRQPLYFQDRDMNLYGLYTQPELNTDRSEGVVICPPAPQESMKLHWAQKRLCEILTNQGFHTLRFDYFGTGDSDGGRKDIDLETWIENTRTAISFLKKKGRLAKVNLIGFRLGGSIAVKTLERTSVRKLILWDPILKGSQYLDILKKMHNSILYDNPNAAPFPSPESNSQQILGYFSPSTFENQLNSLDISNTSINARSTRIITTEHNDQWIEFEKYHKENTGDFELHQIDDNQGWDNAKLLMLRSFPNKIIDTIIQSISEVSLEPKGSNIRAS